MTLLIKILLIVILLPIALNVLFWTLVVIASILTNNRGE